MFYIDTYIELDLSTFEILQDYLNHSTSIASAEIFKISIAWLLLAQLHPWPSRISHKLRPAFQLEGRISTTPATPVPKNDRRYINSFKFLFQTKTAQEDIAVRLSNYQTKSIDRGLAQVTLLSVTRWAWSPSDLSPLTPTVKSI